MAKKKSTPKKHRFKHVESAGVAALPGDSHEQQVVHPAHVSTAPVVRSINAAPGHDYSYVAFDVRRTGILSASLIAVELVLYFVMLHSSVGDAIYKLIKV